MPDSLLKYFKDSDLLRRVDASEANRLSSKAKDCQKQIDAASSVWAVDGKKFLYVFAKKDEGDQKVTVWGIKNPGQYQRIKSVLVVNEDDIFEAIPVFLTEYFNLQLGGIGYRVDEDWYLDIQDELEVLSHHCPDHLKPKQKLLRVWNSIMPRLSQLVIDLDTQRIRDAENAVPTHDALRATPYALPDEIIEEYSTTDNHDLDFLSAALPYEVAACIQDIKVKSSEELQKRQRRIENYTADLTHEMRNTPLDDPKMIRVTNLAAYIGMYARIFGYDELEKGIGKMFRTVAEQSLRRKEPMSLDYLELLVNTRRFNKRLPKQLSDHIRDILDHRVHAKSGFLEQFDECSSSKGKLRKVWIQSMALRLYGYDPNTSYTMEEFSDLMSDLLAERNPDCLLLYALICYDSKFDTVRIDHFDSILLRQADTISDRPSILKLHAALILYQAALIPECGERSPSASCVGSVPSAPLAPQRGQTVSAETAPHADTPYCGASQNAKRATLDAHKDWIPHIEHFLTLHEKGVSMRDFCLVKDLPYQEFLAYFNAAMAEMQEALKTDPTLRKIAMLPKEDQDEYASLMRRQGEVMPEICNCMSRFIGEKIEVEDIKNHPDILAPKVKAMMKRINEFNLKDAPDAFRFIAAYGELERLDQEIESFHRRHSL